MSSLHPPEDKRDRSGTGAGLAMEGQLSSRDLIGVQDFVLLEDFRSETAFVDNLKKRFKENLIYTYIGQVLVSVNPYKNLPIYSQEACKQYRKAHFYEVPPHVFALTDTAYRSLTEEGREQCILISGESGSGKTEASKKVLQFIAAATGHKPNVETVKDKLLQSNPVLEAFGNAKTNRNDNSSRFGKYMDIEFDYTGDPVGGNILNYLLEKSRVVNQYLGERNFHVFYQLLAGADEQMLTKFHLKRNLDTYFYFSHGDKESSDSASQDKADFEAVRKAMTVMELSTSEQDEIFGIVACVLHLGNVGFTEEEGKAKVLKPECVEAISKILGCDKGQLTKALTHRTIDAKGDVVTSPLTREMAIYARDALAKAVYDRLFTWLVTRLNTSLQPQRTRKNTVMGILDIYGFEIFKRNSFEQFCINFCNEKLQQLFIELTLKSEQEEYLKEGIEWEPVKYFNNKVICDLIEQKHRGIISILDEECLRPGVASDMTFLEKMNQSLKHEHYISHRMADTKTQKTMGRDEFQLRHYAGDVTYNVTGFIEKNNDLLFRDLREVMSKTTNTITKTVFPESGISTKKRPDTAITQFKNSLGRLMEILMSKEPSYIRCIKPNETKKAGQFADDIVVHQVKYLGLMENLRVRRAGFAYRRPYEMFLERYKSLCPKTWPHYDGKAKDGVQELVNTLNYGKDDYRMGNTKIFIRLPKTLFETEDAFQLRKHELAAIIQSTWKGRRQRIIYLNMRSSAIIMQKWIRRFLAKRAVERRRKAIVLIRRFVKGFITRNGPPTEINRKFIGLAKVEWLLRLSKNLPTELMDKTWPYCPTICGEASAYLQQMHRRQLALKYRKALSPEKKRMFDLKVLAESIFKDKKKSYKKSIGAAFIDDRLQEPHKQLKMGFIANQLKTGETLKYSTAITKFDRHGYKPRERALLISNKSLYIVDGKNFKIKHSLALEHILELVLTTASDNLLLLRIPTELKKDKGDLILEVNHIIEAITMIVDTTKKPQNVKIMDADTISHNLIGGKQGVIDITTGNLPAISKGKTGHLIVVAAP